MVNTLFKGIHHYKNVMWIKLKPISKTIKKLDRVFREMDDEHNESLLYPEQKIPKYADFIPQRYTHMKDNKVFAITIFQKDFVDLIIMKDHENFDEFINIYNKEFEV